MFKGLEREKGRRESPPGETGNEVLEVVKERAGSTFFCQGCGYESAKWMGFCQACGDRTPLVEAPKPQPGRGSSRISASSEPPQELAQVSAEDGLRASTGFPDLDRVLGGGLVRGSLVLMAGEPGIGKSTLLLQAAEHVALGGGRVMYVTGEESAHQIKLRSDRLGLSGRGVYLMSETDVDETMERLDSFGPSLVIIDSVQTLYSGEVSSSPGSVSQVRECGLKLMRWVKAGSTPLIMAGHVTKDGNLAGPRVLEHMVDVVLYMEGESLSAYRIVRGVKNRFGSTNEVGMFEMAGDGLRQVDDASRALISQRREGAIGSAVIPVLEGSRPLMIEIQALASPSFLNAPRRVGNGVDYNRLLMLVAVLSRRIGLSLSNQDIIVNVVGGLSVHEPAADLAICLAIASSLRNTPLPPDLVALGEVGLSGELRNVPQADRRLDEAARLGFGRCLVPAGSRGGESAVDGISAVRAGTLRQALGLCFPRAARGQSEELQEDGGEAEE